MTGDPPPVVAWEFCDYEGVMVPAGHACKGGGPPSCPTEAGEPCGMCERDLAAQEEYLKRAAEVEDLRRHGTPGDLADTP